MPAYNVAEFLETAVSSVLAQTFTDFEIVVVDDGSTDDTPAIARQLQQRSPERVRVIHQENRGLAGARNSALAAARGRFFALLDSDDVWEPAFLATQLAILDSRPDVDIVTGNARFLGGPDHGRPARPHPDPRPEPTLATILADEAAVFIMSVFRRRVYEGIGAFNEQLRTNEDYEYWLRAAHSQFRFLRNSTPLGWYRVRGDSLSSDSLRMVSGALRVYREFSSRLDPGSREAEILARQVLRFEAELLAPAARHGIRPTPLSNRDFFKGLMALRGAPRKRMAAALARYAPALLRGFDSVRKVTRPGIRRPVATANGTIEHSWTPDIGVRDAPYSTADSSSMRHMTAHADVSDLSAASLDRHAREVAKGERFKFGNNWARFLALVDEDRIRTAEESLRTMLGRADLRGVRFLDIGSGSGLFSLAARRLGAQVHSFDYDPQSVACTSELKRRYFPEDQHWQVEQGSILDPAYVTKLGTFDVVYSWGVLHHTGRMWDAFDQADRLVAPGGLLFIAIYNDRGGQTARWRALKKMYVRLPSILQPGFAALAFFPEELRFAASSLLSGRPGNYVRSWTQYRSNRGMSRWRDIVDWVGGYPYEAAKADTIFKYFRSRDYSLEVLTCDGGLGCNEYVFRKQLPRATATAAGNQQTTLAGKSS